MTASARSLILAALLLVAVVMGALLIHGLWVPETDNPEASSTPPGADDSGQNARGKANLEKSRGTRRRPPGATAGFVECARASGITWQMQFMPGEQGENFKTNLYDHGCGLAVGDYNGDGYDDIYFVNQLGKNALYRNRGDGTFVDVTDEAGVGLGDRICTAATWADYDNSGRQSLFVTSTRGGNVLFKNLGNGQFRDVTKEAGLTHVGHCQTAVFFDYDNDGYLDLLVTNTGQWTRQERGPGGKYFVGGEDLWQLAESPIEHNILYHNNRDGTFTDVTARAGLQGTGWAGDAAVFDYDEDGYLDVLVTNMFGRSHLYHNNRNGTFTEATGVTLGRTSWGAAGAKVFDFNNDGKLDLLITDMHSDMWMRPSASREQVEQLDEKAKYHTVAGPQAAQTVEQQFSDRFHIRYQEVLFGNSFFKNLGQGRFEEMSDRAGLETWWPWGIATGDFDNDGYEDVFIASGMGYPYFYWPNYLLMNNGNETFTDRALEYGVDPPPRGIYLDLRMRNRPATRSSRCCAVADFDGDGRLEIVTNNFNDYPYYFKNDFPKKNYIAFRLRGTKSNRDAIGAVVRLYVVSEILTRQIHPAGGYLSQSSKTVHFGLGDRSTIERVEITWPSGRRQTLPKPGLNQLHRIDEPEN
jgi:hypothetical protein